MPVLFKRAVCIHADEAGNSHLTDLDLPLMRKALGEDGGWRWEGVEPATVWGIAGDDPNHATGWHPCGMAGLSITLEGKWEIEATDGSIRRLTAGDLLVMLDTTGIGHRSRPCGVAPCLTLGIGFGAGIEETMRARLAQTLGPEG